MPHKILSLQTRRRRNALIKIKSSSRYFLRTELLARANGFDEHGEKKTKILKSYYRSHMIYSIDILNPLNDDIYVLKIDFYGKASFHQDWSVSVEAVQNKKIATMSNRLDSTRNDSTKQTHTHDTL